MVELFTLTTPYFVSLTIGLALLELVVPQQKNINFLTKLSLSWGLGIGLTTFISFFNLILFQEFLSNVVIKFHLILLFILFIFIAKREPRGSNSPLLRIPFKHLFPPGILICLFILTILMIPIIRTAYIYPLGGWDAWSVWNLKAKFILLGGKNWVNLLNPILWRTSPHYPLLQPLAVAWGWAFAPEALSSTPLWISVIWTYLTMTLLFGHLYKRTKSYLMLLAPLCLMTLPFFNILATSQYADVVMGFYILASFIYLKEFLTTGSLAYLIFEMLTLGFLSFTKPEGTIAALIILIISIPLLAQTKRIYSKTFLIALIVILLSALPTIIFKIFFSPGNQTFINGLSSQTHPSTLERLKYILVFFFFEFKSPKWNGLWLLLFLGSILSIKRLKRTDISIPLFLTTYLCVIIFYYQTNTYFKIEWWLSVTLNRILFSLCPIFVYWVFDLLWLDSD